MEVPKIFGNLVLILGKPFCNLLLPRKGRLADEGEIIALRSPMEMPQDLGVVCGEGGMIAWPSKLLDNRLISL